MPRSLNTGSGAPRILTNMAFWQSAVWKARTDSIYAVSELHADPEFRPCWIEACQLFARRRHYDVVVTMGSRASLAYGLLCALARVASRQIMCEFFLDDAQPRNPLWRLKTVLSRVVAQRSLGILTNSSAELSSSALRFQLSALRLRYVPMHSNIAEPRMCEASDGYVLAAGRTLRDYPTLLKAAGEIDAPVLIICGRSDLSRSTPPANVTVRREVPREEYLRCLQRCALMALPLLTAERSTGQVVLLEAMAFGKAVVATNCAGTADHIVHGQTGLLVPEKDPRALAQAINSLLKDPALRLRIGSQALEHVRNKCLFDTHAHAKLEAIEDLWRRCRSDSVPAFLSS